MQGCLLQQPGSQKACTYICHTGDLPVCFRIHRPCQAHGLSHLGSTMVIVTLAVPYNGLYGIMGRATTHALDKTSLTARCRPRLPGRLPSPLVIKMSDTNSSLSPTSPTPHLPPCLLAVVHISHLPCPILGVQLADTSSSLSSTPPSSPHPFPQFKICLTLTAHCRPRLPIRPSRWYSVLSAQEERPPQS
eukprot:365399-Chlamydomonas_euryale.AAC.16